MARVRNVVSTLTTAAFSFYASPPLFGNVLTGRKGGEKNNIWIKSVRGSMYTYACKRWDSWVFSFVLQKYFPLLTYPGAGRKCSTVQIPFSFWGLTALLLFDHQVVPLSRPAFQFEHQTDSTDVNRWVIVVRFKHATDGMVKVKVAAWDVGLWKVFADLLKKGEDMPSDYLASISSFQSFCNAPIHFSALLGWHLNICELLGCHVSIKAIFLVILLGYAVTKSKCMYKQGNPICSLVS